MYDFDGASQDDQYFIENQEDGMFTNVLPPFELAKEAYYCRRKHDYMPQFKRPNASLTINQHMFKTLKELNKYKMTNTSKTVPHLTMLPDGAVTFYEANRNNLTLKLQINDLKVANYHRVNGVTRYLIRDTRNKTDPKPRPHPKPEPKPDPHHKNKTKKPSTKNFMKIFDGQLSMMDLISKSYIRTMQEDAMMISGSQTMPLSMSTAAVLSKVISLAGGSLYPIALALLLPVFMQAIVLEKEERLREIMKMNGLKMRNYWFINYIFNMGMYLISAAIFIVVGKFIMRVDFFTRTNIYVLLLSFLGWGFSQVSLAFFFQNFMAKAKTAMIFGYLLAVWTAILGSSFSALIYPSPSEFPFAMRLYPPFAFSRLMYKLSYKCGFNECLAHFSGLDEEMLTCIYVLYGGAVVFLIVGLYLDAVLPQEYGISRHPLFFLQGLCGGRKAVSFESSVQDKLKTATAIGKAGGAAAKGYFGLNVEDEDVSKEREFVDSIRPPFDKYPLVIKNLRKVYDAVGGKPPKTAVRNFSLHIPKGQMFGLLGPNGAGKTSLISMLTGLYPPESGNAWLGGFDIVNNIAGVHTQMGVCPQFDLLWPDLTVEEHLYFYARVRGTPQAEEKALVEKAMKEVYLTKFAEFRTHQLSGGMKRRLSVAISLVGNPKIVFLDEPTTGLDPENRRQLWAILAEARGDKAMVLTTHSMEEADVLCSRIGIITDGALRCIGPQTKLKNKYGGGYHLYINCHKDNYLSKHMNLAKPNGNYEAECWSKLQTYIKNLLPKADLKSCFNGSFVYLVPTEGLEVSKVFEELESKREELAISDWGISQATLEDVFMEIVESAEAVDEDAL